MMSPTFIEFLGWGILVVTTALLIGTLASVVREWWKGRHRADR
jgi:hypothetical protein